MLNSAMMVTESSVILNLLDEALNTSGRSLPIVAFLLIVPLSTSDVTQLPSPDTVHCDPVYPLEHTHEHSEPLDTLTPPFWQGLVLAQAFELPLCFCFGTATRKTGSRMAKTTMMKRRMQSRTNHLRGMPQHFRAGFSAFRSSSFEWRASTLRRPDRPKKTGQELRPSGVCRPGRGKDVRISEMEPEPRRPPGSPDERSRVSNLFTDSAVHSILVSRLTQCSFELGIFVQDISPAGSSSVVKVGCQLGGTSNQIRQAG